jgi:transcription initiation factor TFIID subunit TAF12
LSQASAAGAAVVLSPLDAREGNEQSAADAACVGPRDHQQLSPQQQQQQQQQQVSPQQQQQQEDQQYAHQSFSISCSALRLRTTPVGYGCKANVAGAATTSARPPPLPFLFGLTLNLSSLP